MRIKYLEKEYACRSAKKDKSGLTIYTGQYLEDGEEIIYQFFGDIDFGAVLVEDGELMEEISQEERIEALEEALELLLSGVTE